MLPLYGYNALPLLTENLPDDPLAQLLIGLVVVAAVLLVGKFLLNLAWKLLLLAIAVVGAIYGVGLLL